MCPFQFRVASTLPLIGMAPSQFKRGLERQPTGSDRRWIAPDFRRRRIAGSAAHRRRGPETTHTHVSPARELRRQTEQVLLNVTRPNIPPLPPAAIPVKATASEKQEKHNNYENGCHGRLQKMHMMHFTPDMGSEQLHREPRHLPTRRRPVRQPVQHPLRPCPHLA
jgi:hypothetical protein